MNLRLDSLIPNIPYFHEKHLDLSGQTRTVKDTLTNFPLMTSFSLSIIPPAFNQREDNHPIINAADTLRLLGLLRLISALETFLVLTSSLGTFPQRWTDLEAGDHLQRSFLPRPRPPA